MREVEGHLGALIYLEYHSLGFKGQLMCTDVTGLIVQDDFLCKVQKSTELM
jgi:hypothetical protein